MSAYTCNPVNVISQNGTLVREVTANSQWLQRSTYFAAILFSIFFPMVLLSCQRQNPSRMHEGDEYFQTNTDLPVGFGHMLCYWTDDGWPGRAIRFLRLVISIVLICFCLYPEILLLRLFDETYAQQFLP